LQDIGLFAVTESQRVIFAGEHANRGVQYANPRKAFLFVRDIS